MPRKPKPVEKREAWVACGRVYETELEAHAVEVASWAAEQRWDLLQILLQDPETLAEAAQEAVRIKRKMETERAADQ